MKALKFIASFVIGAGAGLAAGYLTAPRSGKESREKLVDESKEYKDALEKAATQKLAEAKTILNKTIKEKSAQGKQILDQVAEKATM
ncbi:MAG: YtxH domain-containing protein [Reichenbachiella sp.]|uniref:YtxH domain-containing protein n=1 Tax=Reichenbachiella sp. TaxID=2184521 RepID=UPI0029672023|nr:YtxH domain-containing protein [Reichenbachiella sp.]MDW3209493.1 YtxH domain-containing protein [Reichenbachiella sp.]